MKKLWWKEAVVYQIYPKSFRDANGDGIGDIKGITEKLPYVSKLGVDALWLTPFFKSPMIDNGYDISNYRDVDPMFGNKEDIIELIQKSKELNIKILIDLVFNHSSSEHKWFKKAIESKDSKYRDYYIFKESKDGNPPNNWRSIFGGSAWEKSGKNEYYLHTFHKDQPDLNWENPEVRKELQEVVTYWMDLGVSGFRIDAITFIKKPKDYISLESDNIDGLRDIAKDTLNQPGIHDFLQELKKNSYGHDEYMTVAEAPGVDYESLKSYVGDHGDFSMIFDFKYADMDIQSDGSWYPKKNWTIQDYREKIFKSQMEHQKVGWIGLFNESHDQPRSIDKFFGIEKDEENSHKQGTTLATMYFFMRGTPFIYQGQELGIRNHYFNHIDEFNDISSVDHYYRAIALGATSEQALEIVNQRSRDHSRTPMLWSDEAYAGFSDSEPWLPVNVDFKNINAEVQTKQTFSMYKFYKKMIKLRKEEAEILVYGKFEPILEIDADIIAYVRVGEDGSKIIVLCSFSKDLLSFEYNFDEAEYLLGNYADGDITAAYKNGQLRPYEALVLKVK